MFGVPVPVPVQHVTFGHSVQRRALRAVVLGDPAASRRALVVGCIHGNECAGEAIVRRLRWATPPPDTALWLVVTANPDGHARNTRQNARGVDLNRNFPFRWRQLGARGSFDWSGPRRLSEPESRGLRRLILRVRPALTVWYHQHATLVDDSGGDPGVEGAYARAVGLPFRCLPRYPGSATTWQNHVMRRSTAFVVELAAGRLSRGSAERHATAVLAAAAGASDGARSPCRRAGEGL
jgi:protein MpaA